MITKSDNPNSGFYAFGLFFIPFKRLTGKNKEFYEISNYISNPGITPQFWSWDTFYKKANQANPKFTEYDLFLLTDNENNRTRVVIPATNVLWEYNNEKIK